MSLLSSAAVGPAPALLLLALAVICVITDLWKARIFNAVTYPAIAAGLMLQVAAHGVPGLWSALAGFAVGFFPPFLLFALGGIGGGDVKLLAAVGTIAGAAPATEALILGFLFGGVFALAKLAWHGVLFASLWRALKAMAGFVVPGIRRTPLVELGRPSYTIRFGVSIALGTIAMLWDLRTGALSGLLR
jgi:prepilin peptidase CpaA